MSHISQSTLSNLQAPNIPLPGVKNYNINRPTAVIPTFIPTQPKTPSPTLELVFTQKQMDFINKIVNSSKDQLINDLKNKDVEITRLNNLIIGLENSIKATSDSLQNMNSILQETIQGVNTQINEVYSELDVITADKETYNIRQTNINQKILNLEQAQQTLKALLDETNTKFPSVQYIQNVRSELNNTITQNKINSDRSLQALIASVEEVKNTLKTDYEGYVNQKMEELQLLISELKQDITSVRSKPAPTIITENPTLSWKTGITVLTEEEATTFNDEQLDRYKKNLGVQISKYKSDIKVGKDIAIKTPQLNNMMISKDIIDKIIIRRKYPQFAIPFNFPR
jgi:DNA repair exonuclease SbcCD ATPase subunit